MNVHEADQVQAAARDSRAVLTSYAAEKGLPVTDPGPVVRHMLDEFARTVRPGVPVRVCVHAASTTMPVFGRAHRPGELLCAACLHLAARMEADPLEDFRCDCCRTQAGPTIRSVSAVAGPLTLLMGLCLACHERDERDEPGR